MATNIVDYCTYTLNDIAALSDNCWIIFQEDMSTGIFDSEQEARFHNDEYLEWPDVEYITAEEFKKRLVLNPELELEDAGN